jgi:hypothetical protein
VQVTLGAQTILSAMSAQREQLVAARHKWLLKMIAFRNLSRREVLKIKNLVRERAAELVTLFTGFCFQAGHFTQHWPLKRVQLH